MQEKKKKESLLAQKRWFRAEKHDRIAFFSTLISKMTNKTVYLQLDINQLLIFLCLYSM